MSGHLGWWEIIVPIGLWFICDVLKEEEREARKEWEYKRKEINRKVEEYNDSIQDYLSDKSRDYNFQEMISLHHSSVLTANEAYKLMQNARTCLDAVGKMLVSTKDRRILLEGKLNALHDKMEKNEIYKEIRIVQDYRKGLFVDKDKVKVERAELYEKVKHLNNRTHDIKIMIRDHCGTSGDIWYKKLEERKIDKNLMAEDSKRICEEYKEYCTNRSDFTRTEAIFVELRVDPFIEMLAKKK